MALNIRDFDTMVDDVLDRMINTPGSKFTNTIKRPESAVRIMVESIIHELDISGYTLQYAYDNVDFDNATGEEIDRMVKILGVYRDSAVPAEGVIRFGRNTPAGYDIIIPIDTVVSTPVDNDGNSIEFKTKTQATLLTGTSYIDVEIVASVAGAIYVPSGLVSIMPQPIIGIDYVTNQLAINDGQDIETDDALKERARLVRSGLGKGTDSAIESAVKDLSYVLDAKVYDQFRGIATTDVLVICDVMPPTAPMVTEINNIVKSVKASGINALVRFPEVITQNVVYTVVFGTDAPTIDQKNAIGYATIDYFNTLGTGDTLYRNQLVKVSLASHPSIIDITVGTPASNIVPTTEQCIRIGTITINGEVWTIG